MYTKPFALEALNFWFPICFMLLPFLLKSVNPFFLPAPPERFGYIVTQIIPEKSVSAAATFSDAAITKSIRNNVQKYYGDFGSGSINVGFRIKYCNEKTKVTIIRCRHGPHRFITSILPLMTVIGEHRAKFRILYIGATIMQCNKFIVNFQKDCLDRAIGDIESAKDRIDFIKNIMDFKME